MQTIQRSFNQQNNLDNLFDKPEVGVKVNKIFHVPIFNDVFNKHCRFKAISGGRGSGKSFVIASKLIYAARDDAGIHILCARVMQLSADDGLIGDIWDVIKAHGWDDINGNGEFTRFSSKITHINGSEFHFKGTNCSPEELKSFNHYKYLWLEEAENITAKALNTIMTSIRGRGREIFVTWNPDSKSSPVWEYFMERFYYVSKEDQDEIQNIVKDQNPDDDDVYDSLFLVIRCNITHVLQYEKYLSLKHGRRIEFIDKSMRWEHTLDLRNHGTDSEFYRHKWLGEPLDSDNRYPLQDRYDIIDELPQQLEYKQGANGEYSWFFGNDKVRLHGGMDYGYAADPSACNIMFIHINTQLNDKGEEILLKHLYIIDEMHAHHLRAKQLHVAMEHIEYARMHRVLIEADIDNQVMTDELREDFGWNIVDTKKPQRVKGTDERVILAGVNHIAKYDRVFILKKCKFTIEAFEKFSVKIDPKTGKPKEGDDKKFAKTFKHHIDAIRYALRPYILAGKNWMNLLDFSKPFDIGGDTNTEIDLSRIIGDNPRSSNSALKTFAKQNMYTKALKRFH